MNVVMKLDNMDDRAKQKVMKIVSSINGIDSIKAEASAQKLTVVCGSADPVGVVTKVRKKCRAAVISMEAPDKKKKEEEEKKKKEEEEEKKRLEAIAASYTYFNPYPSRPYYCYPVPTHPVEENQVSCVIC